jgi:hypothetical protein
MEHPGEIPPRAFPDCTCKACVDLEAECGSNFHWMSRKLLAKDWPGVTSKAERAYRAAHATWAQHLKTTGFQNGQRRPQEPAEGS